jgi:ABC-type phosphate transport system substrate-binding protein
MKTLQLISLTASLVCTSAWASVVVIVNPAMNETVSKDDIARVYTGRSNVLQPVNLSDANAQRAEFDEKALGRSSSQLKAYWSKLVFTGKGTPPTELASQQAVIDYVAGNEYGVGYVDASQVSDKVKVLLTLD